MPVFWLILAPYTWVSWLRQSAHGVLDSSGSYTPFSSSFAEFPYSHLMFACGSLYLLNQLLNGPSLMTIGRFTNLVTGDRQFKLFMCYFGNLIWSLPHRLLWDSPELGFQRILKCLPSHPLSIRPLCNCLTKCFMYPFSPILSSYTLTKFLLFHLPRTFLVSSHEPSLFLSVSLYK